MRIEQLYQFIVPLMFLAIWAITSLFSKEAQPLPPRTSRPPGPGGPNGPRPGAGTGQSGMQPWRAESFARENPPPRPNPGANPSRPSIRPLNSNDGIVILEPDPVPRRPQNASPQRPQADPRRPVAKDRRKPSVPNRPAEPIPPPQRTLGGSLASSMTSTMEPSQALTKLSLGAHDSPLVGTTNDLTQASAAAVSRPVDRAGPSAHTLRNLLQSPERLQEMMILKEVLGPPVSLRRRSVRRW